MSLKWKFSGLFFSLFSALVVLVFSGCEGCKREERRDPYLKLPFVENFDRPQLGKLWFTEAPGRWWIEYSATMRSGRLCGEMAQNLPLFLRARLPKEVVIELDAWAEEDEGDVKIEIFNDGFFHATGYVLIHGGWHNTYSIIDRLGEHNEDRRWKRGGPKKGKKYHWKVIRRFERDSKGNTVGIIEWYIDGQLFLTYRDPEPLVGEKHEYFAFGNWNAKTCFDNLSIERYQRRGSGPSTSKSTRPIPSQALQKAAEPEPIQGGENNADNLKGKPVQSDTVGSNPGSSERGEKSNQRRADSPKVLSVPAIKRRAGKPLQINLPRLDPKFAPKNLNPVLKMVPQKTER